MAIRAGSDRAPEGPVGGGNNQSKMTHLVAKPVNCAVSAHEGPRPMAFVVV